LDCAFDRIGPAYRSGIRVAKAQHRGDAGWWRHPLGTLGAPAPVVARLLAARDLRGAQGVELGRRRVALIRETAREQVGGNVAITREPLHLIERAFVVIEPQP